MSYCRGSLRYGVSNRTLRKRGSRCCRSAYLLRHSSIFSNRALNLGTLSMLKVIMRLTLCPSTKATDILGAAETALAQWNAVCDALSVGAQLDQSRVPAGLHPTRSATLARGKKVIGVVGEVDPVVLDALGIEGRVSVLEIDLTVILNEEPKPVQARDINRFPSSDIDLAFVLADDVPAQNLQRALRQAAGKRLASIELFDVYRGKGVADGARSLAFRLRLQEPGGTMTESAIAEVQEACRQAAAKIGAELRA